MTTLPSPELDVLAAAAGWREAGHRVALVTVARTWGSSPRPPGSLLVMRDDGSYLGSVSGGCVEADLVERFRTGALAPQCPSTIDYGVDRSEASRLGLPCGGRLEVVVEEVASAAPLRTLVKAVERGDLVRRRVCLATGEVSLHPASREEAFSYDERNLNQVFGPGWHLLLIGDGQLAGYCAEMGGLLGYRVTICDPRTEYAGTPLPSATYTRMMPDDAVRAFADHPRSAVITLAHDPKLDDLALVEALSSRAFYVGALGSRRSQAARLERLHQFGLDTSQLARIHGPIGLPLGGRSPPEIALSILAEVTATRHARAGTETARSGAQ
ncbi:MAG: XdhC family protein [Thiotrichales bacterium]